MSRSHCEIRICFLCDHRQNAFIDSAFNIYMDPKASKETEIDRQISVHHVLVITLMPATAITPNSNEEQLPPRKSSKRPFATMTSIYISSVFGTYIFYNFCSVLKSTAFKGHCFFCWCFSQQILSRRRTGEEHLLLSSCSCSRREKGEVPT
jgi:hypothetical protein